MMKTRFPLVTLLSLLLHFCLFVTPQTYAQVGAKLVGTGFVVGGSPVGVFMGSSLTMSADGNYFAMGGPNDNDSRGAVWVFSRVANGSYVQMGTKLVPTDSTAGSNVGSSNDAVSLNFNGSVLAVGGFNDNSGVGAVWIYTRNGTTWTQQGTKHIGTGAIDPSGQGLAVALNDAGNVLVVSGPYDNTLMN